MTEKPKALLWADFLDQMWAAEPAAELRRLHHENERLKAEVLMEREACADICDGIIYHYGKEADRCAAAIRARSKT